MKILNRYELTQEIGRGADAIVWQAIDRGRADQPVAVKILTNPEPAAMKALANEFSRLFSLQHPNLPAAYAFGLFPEGSVVENAEKSDKNIEAFAFLVLDLLDNDQSFSDATALNPPEAALIGAHIAAALATLHTAGLRHGDITPRNILLTGSPVSHAWLIDFGLCQPAEQAISAGTPRYMAPEALEGSPTLKSDLWGLGATLWALLQGHEPRGELATQLQSPHLGEIIAALTHEDAERRPDAAELFDILVPHTPPSHHKELRELQNGFNTPSLLLQPQALKQLSPKPAQAQKGSQVIRLQGKPGTGKTSALKALLSSAALSGFSTPTGILHGKSASLFTLFRALGIHRDSQDSQKHPLSKLQSWSILAEELVTYTRTHGPLALAIDDLPCDSTIEGLGDFLERLGDDGPNILWLQSQREACDSDETAHSIAPLTEEETGHFIRASRPLRPGDAKAAFEVMKPSGGNAREITRLLTAYPGESLLSEAQSGLVLPTSEKGYGQTIAQLPAKTRSALALLYIARSPLPLKILSSLLSFKELLAEESLTPLKNEGLIEVQNSGEGVILSLSTPARIPKLSQYFQKNEAATLIAHLKTTQSGHELAIAHLLLQLGEPKEAGRRLIQVATTADEDQKRFIAEGIQEILKDYLLEEPLRIQAHLTLAKIQEENAQNEEAYQNYQAAGDNESAIAGQMRTLSARGHYDQIFVLAASAKFTEPLRSAAEAITARAALLAGQHNKARDLAEDALKNSSAHTEEGELLGTIGLVHYFSGQNDDSIDCFNRAIQWSSNHQDKGRERLRANLALVYQKSGKINLAQKLYEEALAAAKKDHDLPTQLRRLINLATLYQDEHKTDAALKAYDEALSIARTTLGHREFVRAALNLANLHNHLGNPATALTLVDEALALAKNTGMQSESAYLLLIQAESQIASDAFSEALNSLQTPLLQERALEEKTIQLELNLLHAQLDLRKNDLLAASSWAHKAQTQADSLGRALSMTRARLLLCRILIAQDKSSGVTTILDESAKNLPEDDEIQWQYHALLSVALYATGQQTQAAEHQQKSKKYWDKVRARLPAHRESTYSQAWWRRTLLQQIPQTGGDEEQDMRDLERLLAINRELAHDHNPERLLERILDAAIALSGAERGLLILKDAGGELKLNAARNMGEENLGEEAMRFSHSIAEEAMQSGAPVSTVDAQSDSRFAANLSVHALKIRSVLCLPLRSPKGALGALYLDNRYRKRAFSENEITLLGAFGDQAAIALTNARLVSQLSSHTHDLETSRSTIEDLNQRLEKELEARFQELEAVRARESLSSKNQAPGQHGMVGRTPAMQSLYQMIDRVSDKAVPVIILGESGTGKELVARAVHTASGREGPFVSVNCGAIPADLLESELFGHERGAFTGAVRAKPGLFEIANNGTLFLDEIAELPLSMQVKLLRALQEKEFRRVGGVQSIKTTARVLSASNKELETMVREGSFREDLWYRINVVTLQLPPLRERRNDLPLLIEYFLNIHGGKTATPLSREARGALLDYEWPGNIRQLENEIQRALALAEGSIQPEDLSANFQRREGKISSGSGELKSQVDSFEHQIIKATLQEERWKVTSAAKRLGLTRAGLYKKLNKYGIQRPT